MVERKCIGCGKIKDRNELIKITRNSSSDFYRVCKKEADTNASNVVINNSNKIFGRSVYLCYNISCIEAAFKKNKIGKALKTSIPDDLKGRLINEF